MILALALALQPVVAAAVVVSEVMPNPVGITDAQGEWVEIQNKSDVAQDVSGWTLNTGEASSYVFPASTTIGAGEFYVVCRNSSTAEVICDASWSGMRLSNVAADTITLSDSAAIVVDDFQYLAADVSGGDSIEVVHENGNETAVKNSTDSYGTHNNTGTPGSVNAAQPTATAVTNTRNGMVYDTLQSAIDDAVAGDALRVNQNLTTSAAVKVTKSLTINGSNHTIDAAFTKTNNSNNAAIMVLSDNVTIHNITLDGTNGTNLHGFNVYESVNVVLNDITSNNFRSGVSINSSTVSINNISTSGNVWHSINVDQTTSQVARLTISGTNSHLENSPNPTNDFNDSIQVPHILVDDLSDDVIVSDVDYQYALNEVSFRGKVALLGTLDADTSVVSGEEDVSGSTAASENQPGWLFNRDASTSTPFEFNKTAATHGLGSLYVKPIGTNPSDKFVAEFFALEEMRNVESLSYDFKIGSGGSDVDANQFYMSVYANFASSDDTKFYDCRYSVVPTSGSISGFTTVTFDPSKSYPVQTRGSSPKACPSQPLAMWEDTNTDGKYSTDEGGFLRMFALNVGDTSGSDAGLDGYIDNVIFMTTDTETVYDFEPKAETPTGGSGGGSGETFVPISTVNGALSSLVSRGSSNFASSAIGAFGITTTEAEDQATLGVQTKKNSAKTSAVQASDKGWIIFGLAWYWWILILAALAGLVWFLVRRRNNA